MTAQPQKTLSNALMQAIQSQEICYLKKFLPSNPYANLLLLGDEIPSQLWERHEWHGILSIQQELVNRLNIPQIQAHHHELPLLADCIDFAVVYHALDFAAKTKCVLKELWRVLAPEGKMLMIGYNHRALFGLPDSVVKQFQQHKKKGFETLSAQKLSNLVRKEGFVEEHYQTFCFQPPIRQAMILNKLNIFEKIGQFCWPYLGMVYLLIVNKPLLTITPVKKRKKPKPLFAIKGLTAPTYRHKSG